MILGRISNFLKDYLLSSQQFRRTKLNNDKLIIIGKQFKKKGIKKIKVPSLGDHRICQSAAILGLLTGMKVEIKNFETVRTSAPSFLKIVKKLGGSFEKKI